MNTSAEQLSDWAPQALLEAVNHYPFFFFKKKKQGNKALMQKMTTAAAVALLQQEENLKFPQNYSRKSPVS